MKQDKKGSRPKKGPAEKMSYRISFMLCTKDYYALKVDAASAGLRLAEFARLAVTGCHIKPRITPEEAGWLRKLSGMSNNLNQLAVLAHRSGYSEAAAGNVQLAGEISATIKRLRNDG